MNPGYDTEGWEAPYRYSDMNQAVSPGNLQKRPIPFLFRTAYLHLALDRVQRRRFLFFSQKDMYLEENEVI